MKTVLTAALIAGAVLVPGTALATTPGPKVSEAFFKVRVEGVQTTTWTANHTPMFRCDSPYTGSGSERVTFESTRAVKVRAFRLGRGPVYLVRGRGLAVLPTSGYVRRSGTINRDPPTPECAVGDGDGNSQPPPSDCGRKRIASLPLRIAYDALKADRMTLSRSTQPGGPVFQQCPLIGDGWPDVLSRDDRKRTAGEELPRGDLFDRSQGKIILLGKGTVRSNAFGDSSTTKIRWDLTLTRVRG